MPNNYTIQQYIELGHPSTNNAETKHRFFKVGSGCLAEKTHEEAPIIHDQNGSNITLNQLTRYISNGEPIPLAEARKISRELCMASKLDPRLTERAFRLNQSLILGKSKINFADGNTLYVQRERLCGGNPTDYTVFIASTIAGICYAAAAASPAGFIGAVIGVGLTIFQFFAKNQSNFSGQSPLSFLVDLLQSHKLNDIVAKANVAKGRLEAYIHTQDPTDLEEALKHVELAHEEYKEHFKQQKYPGLQLFMLLSCLRISIHIEKAEKNHPCHLEIARGLAKEAIAWIKDCHLPPRKPISKNTIDKRTPFEIASAAFLVIRSSYLDIFGKLNLSLRDRGYLQNSLGSILATDKPLLPDQKLLSSNRRFELLLQQDGNLVEYDLFYDHPVWASNTAGQKITKLLAEGSGSLALYVGDACVWSTCTSQNAPQYSPLMLCDNGDIQLVSRGGSLLWRAGPDGSTLGTGQSLYVLQRLVSKNGRYQLVLQTNGNLVEWDMSNNKIIWASDTADRHITHISESDGSLALYAGKSCMWSTCTSQNPPPRSKLLLSDHGDIKLVRPEGDVLWQHRNNSINDSARSREMLSAFFENPLIGNPLIGNALFRNTL